MRCVLGDFIEFGDKVEIVVVDACLDSTRNG